MGKYCIGIDVGGTTVKLGIFEQTGELLRKWEIPTRTEHNGCNILTDVAVSIRRTLGEMGIAFSDVGGAGMGVPGPVARNGFVPRCVNLGWGACYPARDLSLMLDGLPVFCANDANIAALGEMWQGGGKGYDDIVMITLGTGVGGGVVVDQKIIAGRHGLAGEIGHTHVRDDEPEYCNCGSRGCLEQVASATGIVREAKRFLNSSGEDSSLRDIEADRLTAKDVIDAAKAGDGLAMEIVEYVCYYLGRSLAQLALTIDPEIFVIGGGVSKAGQFLIDIIQKYYEEYEKLSEDRPLIGLAKLGNDAGIYGAARMVLD